MKSTSRTLRSRWNTGGTALSGQKKHGQRALYLVGYEDHPDLQELGIDECRRFEALAKEDFVDPTTNKIVRREEPVGQEFAVLWSKGVGWITVKVESRLRQRTSLYAQRHVSRSVQRSASKAAQQHGPA